MQNGYLGFFYCSFDPQYKNVFLKNAHQYKICQYTFSKMLKTEHMLFIYTVSISVHNFKWMAKLLPSVLYFPKKTYQFMM